jgi:hypothetical protein
MMLVREFTRALLRQPAVADFVRSEHFSNPAAEPPAGIGDALRLVMLEVLGATTTEDCDQLARYFLAYARECMEDDASSVVLLSGAPVRDGWAPPAGVLRAWARRAARRKPRVSVAPSDILAWLTERGSATTREIARHFDVSDSSVWRHADALVHQGSAEVVPGGPSRPRVYSVSRATEPPAASRDGEVPDAPEEGPRESTCPSSRIELDVFTPTDKPESRSRQMTTEGTEELEAEIAVGEKYGDELWRIKEVETGNILRDAITSEREYLWLLDSFNRGDEYADEQQARRDAAPTGA